MPKLPSLEDFNHILNKISVLTENRQYATKRAAMNAIYKLLGDAVVKGPDGKDRKLEGNYHDEYWAGPSAVMEVLHGAGYEPDGFMGKYYHIKDYNTTLPNGKHFNTNIPVTTTDGKIHMLPFQINCQFLGQTGTMEDGVYEMTWVFNM